MFCLLSSYHMRVENFSSETLECSLESFLQRKLRRCEKSLWMIRSLEEKLGGIIFRHLLFSHFDFLGFCGLIKWWVSKVVDSWIKYCDGCCDMLWREMESYIYIKIILFEVGMEFLLIYIYKDHSFWNGHGISA